MILDILWNIKEVKAISELNHHDSIILVKTVKENISKATVVKDIVAYNNKTKDLFLGKVINKNLVSKQNLKNYK